MDYTGASVVFTTLYHATGFKVTETGIIRDVLPGDFFRVEYVDGEHDGHFVVMPKSDFTFIGEGHDDKGDEWKTNA